jgi:hypothetical protein
MPLFRRADADLVTDESPLRTILPYLLKTRNQSAIYHEAVYDLTRTLAWLGKFNAPDRRRTATLFHLLIYAAGRALREHPHLNRFISGRRIYQHRDVQITFAAKKVMTPEAPLTMIKVPLNAEDSFEDFIDRTRGQIRQGRGEEEHHGRDKLDLLLKLPGFMIGAAAGLWGLADRWNLLPGSWLADDPMYTSICFTNVGSVGLNDLTHHLSEYGTASLFAAMGRQQKSLFVGPDGEPAVREGLQVQWSADERICDGFYTSRCLQRVREIIEDPAAHVVTADRAGSPRERPASAHAGRPSR